MISNHKKNIYMFICLHNTVVEKMHCIAVKTMGFGLDAGKHQANCMLVCTTGGFNKMSLKYQPECKVGHTVRPFSQQRYAVNVS